MRIAGFSDAFMSFQYAASSRVMDTDSTEFHFLKTQSGMDVFRGLMSGYLHVGVMGSAPLTTTATRTAHLKDNRIIAFYANLFITDGTEALVLRSSLGIKEPRDLIKVRKEQNRPVRIAAPFGSTSNFYLIVGLSIFGVQTAPGPVEPPSANSTRAEISSQVHVHIIYLNPPQILSEFQRGNIDGAFIWNPVLDLLKQSGALFLLGSTGISKFRPPIANIYVTTSKFLREHGDVIQHVVNVHPGH